MQALFARAGLAPGELLFHWTGEVRQRNEYLNNEIFIQRRAASSGDREAAGAEAAGARPLLPGVRQLIIKFTAESPSLKLWVKEGVSICWEVRHGGTNAAELSP